MKILRDYQQDSVDRVRASLKAGWMRPLLVQPTGGGKTLTAAEICRLSAEKGNKVIFIAPRRKLVKQTEKAFREHGLDPGIIMAGVNPKYHKMVQVASAQTLLARGKEGFPEDIKLIVYDEVHESTLGSVKTLIEAFGCRALGLTATPARTDGTGLGVVFDDLIVGVSVAELTRLGHLVPMRYFAPSAPDLKGVRSIGGDYNQKQLGERMTPLIGDVVANWLRICPTLKTVLFAVTIANAVAFCEAFKAAGIASEWVSGETPEEEQEAIFARHAEGITQVLCNAQLLSFGWDSPSIQCCILAKPTKSIPNYLQMAGRVLRPWPDKLYSILIDHSGIVDKLGFVDDDFGWTLDGKEACENLSMKKRKEQKPITCGKCKMVYKPQPKCPFCGAESHHKPKDAKTVQAELQEVERKEGNKANKTWPMEKKRQFYAELIGYAAFKGFKIGWAKHKYHEKFQVWPNAHRNVSGTSASFETSKWIQSRNIARAEANKKAEGVPAE